MESKIKKKLAKRLKEIQELEDLKELGIEDPRERLSLGDRLLWAELVSLRGEFRWLFGLNLTILAIIIGLLVVILQAVL